MNTRAIALSSTVPTLIGASACGADEDESFRVTRVEFDNASTITLTFSEALTDVGAVDPNDFRLSFAVTSQYTYTYDGQSVTYESTRYMDVATLMANNSYYEPFLFGSISAGSSPTQIELETATPLGPAACTALDAYREQFAMYIEEYGGKFDTALFLHYAAGDVPITSTDMRELGDVGPDWVLDGEYTQYTYSYGFKMAPQLRIPCP